ncbi:hypothetical protein ACFVT5_31525 [Streptomyces sp. NPDC058001]|uniref:hypothetical protein n=1 Tax=Streptomyces sp. NPDC058001 TaxID=3346300 RepID=UPI0036E8FFB9
MLWEALGSGVVGLALAWVALRRMPDRLPTPALVLPTGIAGALFGAFVTHTALGAGNIAATLIGAAAISTALLSLLLRPRRLRRSAPA